MSFEQPSPPEIHPTIAVFNGIGQPLEFRSKLDCPTLGRGEYLVEISLATICGSDLHTIDGRRREPTPCVLGHEGVGRVIAFGPEGNPSLLGCRITWTIADSCGVCRPCQTWDLPQKCVKLFKYGHAPLTDGTGLNGTYATHIVLRAGTTIIPLPDSVTDAMAAPANCALATMAAATEPLCSPGGIAVVQGAGLLGLFGCALLRNLGWQRVIVVDTNPGRLALAPLVGGEPALNTALGVLSSGSVDAVIEVTGCPEVIAEGLTLLRPGGHYQWVGMVHPESQLTLTGESIVRKCLTIQGNHNYSPRHLSTAVEYLIGQGQKLPWERLVSPPLPLHSLGAAVELARSGRWPRVAIQPLNPMAASVAQA